MPTSVPDGLAGCRIPKRDLSADATGGEPQAVRRRRQSTMDEVARHVEDPEALHIEGVPDSNLAVHVGCREPVPFSAVAHGVHAGIALWNSDFASTLPCLGVKNSDRRIPPRCCQRLS